MLGKIKLCGGGELLQPWIFAITSLGLGQGFVFLDFDRFEFELRVRWAWYQDKIMG